MVQGKRWKVLQAIAVLGGLVVLPIQLALHVARDERNDARRAVTPGNASDQVDAPAEMVGEEGGAMARKSLAGTHRQVRVIQTRDASNALNLKGFSLDAAGRIVLVEATGGDGHTMAESKPEAVMASRIRILSPQGETETVIPLDFRGVAVNVGHDGNLYVGGAGVIARYTPSGEQLARVVAPHLAGLATDAAALNERARETLREQQASMQATLETLRTEYEALKSRPSSDLTVEERESLAQGPLNIETYEQMLADLEEPTEQLVQSTASSLSERQTRINAIAANDRYVFVTSPATRGYGYTVWRSDLNLQNAKLIVEGLRGCCGQMDVQCCADGLLVAENARHRVVRYDAEGKRLFTFGKRSRDGEGAGFSSCCNPMNTRLVGEKLYVSESDGTIKLFDQEGNYQAFVGKAGVSAGCKSSIVAATSDASRVYYFDVENSAICVFERAGDMAQVAP